MQNGHIRSSLFKLTYLPVSIGSLCAPNLNLAMDFLKTCLIGSVKYTAGLKVSVIVSYFSESVLWVLWVFLIVLSPKLLIVAGALCLSYSIIIKAISQSWGLSWLSYSINIKAISSCYLF